MKKCFLLSIIGFSLISWTSIAQTRTVELPIYEGCNWGFLEITKLELKESETVLYCDGFETPNKSISLSSKIYLQGKSGKIYKFIRSEDFEMDKRIFMLVSGMVSFKLHMEPLDKKETSFDFIEGKSYNELKIMGIRTHKTNSTAPIHCIIKGEVIDRLESSRLKLVKTFEDDNLGKYITIHNGKFEYELDCHYLESYSLIFDDEYKRGLWWPIIIFPESGTVNFKLFPIDRRRENVVTVVVKSITSTNIKLSKQTIQLTNVGSLNQQWLRYQTLKDSLFNRDSFNKEDEKLRNENHFYSEVARKQMDQYITTNNESERDSLKTILVTLQEKDKLLTPEAMSLVKQMEEMEEQSRKWTMKYIRENTSIVGYSLLIKTTKDAALSYREYFPECIDLYNSIYIKKYPNHPYLKVMNDEISRFMSVLVGHPYIDFIAPDFNGKPVRLSDQIKGKVAFIDLWASWCLPCRLKAKSMIPVYETYKEKGFTIIGVAREDSLENGIMAAQKDKYPWLNLIELKDKEKIWEKYGVGNSGGGTFLVDKNGIILAVNPTIFEVENILDKLLK
ncbi:MAG: TlpA disulfide reductase family protein [Paludibacter sp.]|nr:TlpA disulfide reductase family protein [Paludibacter sp.]